MCYDIKASLESQLKRAKRNNDLTAIIEISEKLAPLTDLPLYHAMGFDHPKLLIYTMQSPDLPELATWGLIPDWITHEDDIPSIWNATVNAKNETIFSKPAYRDSAINGRCILLIDGFYEHRHQNNKSYPYFIKRIDNQPIAVAALYNQWINPITNTKTNSFSIVTCKANELMASINNNPKLSEPRMPLLLDETQEDIWLNNAANQEDIKQIALPFKEELLQAHTVKTIRGKKAFGNKKGVDQPYTYSELDQPTLFD